MIVLVNNKISAEWDGNKSKCRSCGAAIGFGVTANQKRIPFDLDNENAEFPLSHWATCPEAAKFRKGSK